MLVFRGVAHKNPPFWMVFTRISMGIFMGELLVSRRVRIHAASGCHGGVEDQWLVTGLFHLLIHWIY